MKLNSSSLPENIRRCMTPAQRKAEGAPTADELKQACAGALEKKLHKDFIQWLQLHEEITWDHQRMDRKATNTPGWPDFSLFANGRACFVEFKVPPNKVSQAQECCGLNLLRNGFMTLVTGQLEHAIEFAKKELTL